MAEQPTPAQPQSTAADRLRADAEMFLRNIGDVEKIIESFPPGMTPDEVSSNKLQQRLDEMKCLRFLAWCTHEPEEEVSARLRESHVPPESITRILGFSNRHRPLGDFLARLYRTDQGYENELTRLEALPVLYLTSRTPVVHLRIYSHDRLVISAKQSLSGMLAFAETIIDTIYDLVRYLKRVNPTLAADSVDREEVRDLLNTVEKLKTVLEPADKE